MTVNPPRKVFMSVDAVGGVWTYALELARSLSSQGTQTALAVLGPAPSDAQRETASRIAGVEVVTTGLPLDWTAHSEAELDQVAEDLKARARAACADLVHLNAPGHAGITMWDLPLVVAAHSCVATWWRSSREGPLPPDLAWRARRTACGMGLANAVIAPSRSFARHLRAAYGGGHRIDVVHNARQRRRSSLAQERDAVLTAGRLWDPTKNARVIDDAAALLQVPIHAAGPTAGPNGERAAFSNLALLGTLSDTELRERYERTAIFVSMSSYEPFGLSVLEAAQAGAALVLSDIDTHRELWNAAACFVPPHDSAALASAIECLSRNREMREDLARRAGKRAYRYSPRRQLGATLGIYHQARLAYLERMQSRSAA